MKRFFAFCFCFFAICSPSFCQTVEIEAAGTLRGHRAAVNTLDVICPKKGAPRLTSGSDDCRVAVWNLETSELISAVKVKVENEWADGVVFSRFLKNGNILFALRKKRIAVWNTKTPQFNQLYEGETTGKRWAASEILGLAGSPDGKFCAFVNPPYSVQIAAVPSFKIVQRFDVSDRERLNCIAITPDSKYIICGGNGGKIYVFSLPEKELVFDEKNGEAPVVAVGVTTDGKTVVACDAAGFVTAWDFQTGEKVGSAAASSPIRCASIVSADVVVCGCEDGAVRFLDFKTGELLGEKIAHEGPVRCLCFYKIGAFVTGGEDKKIKKWSYTISE